MWPIEYYPLLVKNKLSNLVNSTIHSSVHAQNLKELLFEFGFYIFSIIIEINWYYKSI